MPGQEESKTILNDLNSYFSGSGVASSYEPDPQIAKLLIERWGIKAVVMGFGRVIEDIGKITHSTVGMIGAEEIGDRVIASRAMGLMSYMFDLIKAFGNEASSQLAYIIKNVPNEDIRALAAYSFATDRFVDPSYRSVLIEAYNNSEGTGCRMALALALFMSGERIYLKQYISKGMFCSPDYYHQLENGLRRNHPELNQSEREMAIVVMLVVPETQGIPSAHSGLMGILSLDIGTNGLAWRNRPGLDWKRKR